MAADKVKDLEAQSTLGPNADLEKQSEIEPTASLRRIRSRPREDGSIQSQIHDSTNDGSARVSSSEASDACTDRADEAQNLFDFVASLEQETLPAEPWFLEMSRLRWLHFLHINKKLAACKKTTFEASRATDSDMQRLSVLFHEQANAIRDYQLIVSLDRLSEKQKVLRLNESSRFFPVTGTSVFPEVEPFESASYRCLPRRAIGREAVNDVREFLRGYSTVSFTWTEEEKQTHPDNFDQRYMPERLSWKAEILARFIVPMTGALFVLVPMYIMALGTSRTENLVTTTVAVLLFALVCSLTLRRSNDQALGATAAYAAVLMVFVGFTS